MDQFTLYYAAVTRLNGGLQEKHLRRYKFCLTQRCRLHLGIVDKNAALWNYSQGNMPTPSWMALYHPGCKKKVLAVKAPRNLYTLTMSPSILQRNNKNQQVGLSKFPNNAHDAFLITN
jgi:hypothetical protein